MREISSKRTRSTRRVLIVIIVDPIPQPTCQRLLLLASLAAATTSDVIGMRRLREMSGKSTLTSPRPWTDWLLPSNHCPVVAVAAAWPLISRSDGIIITTLPVCHLLHRRSLRRQRRRLSLLQLLRQEQLQPACIHACCRRRCLSEQVALAHPRWRDHRPVMA